MASCRVRGGRWRRCCASGAAAEVLADWASPPADIYAVYLTRDKLSARVRAFVDFLAERLGAYELHRALPRLVASPATPAGGGVEGDRARHGWYALGSAPPPIPEFPSHMRTHDPLQRGPIPTSSTPATRRPSAARAWSCGSLATMVVEIAAGLWFNSMALLADEQHEFARAGDRPGLRLCRRAGLAQRCPTPSARGRSRCWRPSPVPSSLLGVAAPRDRRLGRAAVQPTGHPLSGGRWPSPPSACS